MNHCLAVSLWIILMVLQVLANDDAVASEIQFLYYAHKLEIQSGLQREMRTEFTPSKDRPYLSWWEFAKPMVDNPQHTKSIGGLDWGWEADWEEADKTVFDPDQSHLDRLLAKAKANGVTRLRYKMDHLSRNVDNMFRSFRDGKRRAPPGFRRMLEEVMKKMGPEMEEMDRSRPTEVTPKVKAADLAKCAESLTNVISLRFQAMKATYEAFFKGISPLTDKLLVAYEEADKPKVGYNWKASWAAIKAEQEAIKAQKSDYLTEIRNLQDGIKKFGLPGEFPGGGQWPHGVELHQRILHEANTAHGVMKKAADRRANGKTPLWDKPYESTCNK